MLHHKQAVKLKRLIEDYAATMVTDSWVRSADPEDYENIRGDHQAAKEALYTYIAEVTRVKK